MKKTFRLTHPKIKPARLADAARCDVKKYIKRERKKALPEGFDQWEFDCKFGVDAKEAETVQLSDISKCISAAETEQLDSFYLEILARAAYRTDKQD